MDNYSTLAHLKKCLIKEVIKSETKNFSWWRVIRRAWRYPNRRFNFWWRIANFLFHSQKNIKLAYYINRRLQAKYGCDLGIGAKIDEGLTINHYVGLVVACEVEIGKNFHVRQNTTIGIQSSIQNGIIHIGDDVTIGANTCLIGNNLRIGNNVMIGAMSFINKNIPDNSIVYTPKDINIIIESHKNNRTVW